MTRSWDKFTLLFWKNWLLQRRHRTQTIVEIVVPVLFSALLVLIRSLVEVEIISEPTIYEPFLPDHLPRQNITLPTPIFNGTIGDLEPFIDICDILLNGDSLQPPKNLKIDLNLEKWVTEGNETRNAVTENLTAELRNVLINEWIVFYSPQTAFMDGFMKEVSKHNTNRFISCAAENATDLEYQLNVGREYLRGNTLMSIVLAGVAFPDSLANATELPINLNVSIRFPGERRITDINEDTDQSSQQVGVPRNWFTQLLFPLFQTPGPRNELENDGGSPGYYNEGFLSIQSAISSVFIKNVSKGVAPDLNIFLQRFPYPPYVDDPLLQAMESFIPLIIMLSFVYSAISTVRIVTTEKEKQLKEAMKMMGLPNWLHWCAWFTKSLIFFFISIVFITVLLKAPIAGGDRYVLPASDWSCILAFLFVFIMASITFCFAVSSFFSKANIAAIVSGLVWFLCYFPYVFLQNSYSTTGLGTKIGVSFFSNTAMAYGFQIILMYEGTGEGLQWSNMWSPVTPEDTLTMGHAMGMLLVDCILYMLITIYVETVFPGEYGVPQPFYFPFTRSYWLGEKVSGEDPPEIESQTAVGIAEPEPKNLTAGVQIRGLRKVYGNGKVAVEGLTLNMYEGQITVLLGHNGAGKTTTMSILTGLYTPTSGTAKISGHDIRRDMDGAREKLGLCPQHNVLFDELSVKEHLDFFGKLKGLSGKALQKETNRFIEMLELVPKTNTAASALSGGMQRKLAAAVALCGGSKVVLFDEPTSGMDPGARRALWDLLQSEKEGRTILLTTHFMDEADILGDRIAIMSEGRLQCVGSSFFLKKKFGGGYHLVLVKEKRCISSLVTSVLDQFMPGISPTQDIGTELSYHLDDNYLPQFEHIFTELESRKEQLGIQSYGVSLTTMEEVFIKVGSDVEVSKGEEEAKADGLSTIELDSNGVADKDTSLTLGRAPLLVGFNLLWNQTLAMWYKYIISTYRSWILYLIVVIIPVLDLTIAVLVGRNFQGADDLPARELTLKDYNGGVVTLASTEGALPDIVAAYRDLVGQDTSDVRYLNDMDGEKNVSNYILESGEQDVGGVSQAFILGTTFEEGNVTAMFNNQPYHAPPLALSYVYNAILRAYVGKESGINFVNQPMPYTTQTKILLLQTGGTMGFQIAFNLGFSFAFVASYFVVFYIRERMSKAKLLQFVSGVNVVTFWVTAYLWNIIASVGPLIAVIITFLALQEDGFSTAEELGRTFLVMLCCMIANLPLVYLSSFLFTVPAGGFSRLIMFNVFTGVAAFIVVMVLQTPDLDLVGVANTLDWIFTFLPTYSLTYSFSNMNRNYLIGKACTQYATHCETVPNVCCKEPAQCPNGECAKWTEDFFDFEQPGIGRNIAMFFVTGGVLFAILMIVEHGLFEMLFYKSKGKNLTAETEPSDPDVKAENLKVSEIASADRQQYNLLLQTVTKYYKNFRAVTNLNLAVREGECFGLLGVNGAGKTTTFKMLTGDEQITVGDAYVQGMSLKYSMKQVRQLIGYCPQFDAVLDDLTGRETLRLFCLLRGVPNYEIKGMSERLAKELLFLKHLDKKVKEYSGGNKRKLSTAVALVGDPPVVYLDEPTTGMDPVAKRHLWDVICKIRDSGKTIILTSHSMEECEALCTRLAIMVNGEFKCIGSTQHLKNTFAEGYTLTIKVQRLEIGVVSAKSNGFDHRRSSRRRDSAAVELDTRNVKAFVEDNFVGANLREEYQGLLTYQLPRTNLTWARMFGIMEAGKGKLNIEDYSLGQTSLEQVFLSFTKYQGTRQNVDAE